MSTEHDQSPEFVRIKGVIAVTDLSRSSIYDLIKNGDFPRPVAISAKRSGWLRSEIAAWMRARIEARDQQSQHDNSKRKRIQRRA
jgi:prophage regulatory protein